MAQPGKLAAAARATRKRRLSLLIDRPVEEGADGVAKAVGGPVLLGSTPSF